MLCQAVIALPPHRIVLPVRCMDRSFLYIQRGLPQRFGDGGMTMNGRDQFIHRGLQSDGQRALGNEVCGSWSYVPYKIGKLQIQGFSEPITSKKIKQSYHITQKAARSRQRAAFLRGKLGRRQKFSKK